MATAESCPRESFLMWVFIGSRNSPTSRRANSASQPAWNQGAARRTWVTLKSSGYFWFSRAKLSPASTAAFSNGSPPRTLASPEVLSSWPARIDISVVLPAPLRPSRPQMVFFSMSRVTWLSTVVAPYFLVSDRVSIAGFIVSCLSRWSGNDGALADHRDQFLGVDAEAGRLAHQRGNVLCPECLAALCREFGACAGGYEHADTPSLVEDPGVDQAVQGLAGSCRVDAHERREFVGRRHLGFLGVGAVKDVFLDLLRQLDEDRLRVIHETDRSSLVHYSCS